MKTMTINSKRAQVSSGDIPTWMFMFQGRFSPETFKQIHPEIYESLGMGEMTTWGGRLFQKLADLGIFSLEIIMFDDFILSKKHKETNYQERRKVIGMATLVGKIKGMGEDSVSFWEERDMDSRLSPFSKKDFGRFNGIKIIEEGNYIVEKIDLQKK